MKKKMMIQQVILGAAFVMCPFLGFSANAQSTSSEIVPTIDGGGSNTATSNAASQAASQTKLHIKYLGIFNGPGANFSGPKNAEVYDQGMYLNNRPKFLVQTSDNFDFGLETRFNANFGARYNKGSNLKVENSAYRLLGEFKNVIKTDTLAVAIVPRLVLPSTNKQHEQHFRAGPEALLNLDYAPKNTRFSFNTGLLYQYGIYGSDTVGDGYTKATTSVFQPWVETDYQVSPKVQAFVAYWPEFVSKARQGVPLSTDSNEVDLGTYFQVAKGWQIAPYISMEPIGMKNLGQATQFNFYVIGSVL